MLSSIKFTKYFFEELIKTDDIKISLENNILNELMFRVKYDKNEDLGKYNKNFEMIRQKLVESDYINIINLTYKKEINEFINDLTQEEINIKHAKEKYYNSLEKNEKIENIAKIINTDFEKYSFFKNNKVKIYLDVNQDSTPKICNCFKDIFNCQFSLLELNIENYKSYLLNLFGDIDKWIYEIT